MDLDWRVATAGAAALVGLLCAVWWARRRRARGPEMESPARQRAEELAALALSAYRTARSEDPTLPREEWLVRALVAASGEPESQVRKQVTRAMGISSLHGTLQGLVTAIAAQREHDLGAGLDYYARMRNVTEAQAAVMKTIPLDT